MLKNIITVVGSEPYEPRCEKTILWGFGPGLTQTDLYSHRRRLEALNFGSTKKRNYSENKGADKLRSYC